MICPKCKGETTVTDTVNNDDGNETMRRRRCKVCGHVFHTLEYLVYQDREYTEDWNKYYRKSKRRKKND